MITHNPEALIAAYREQYENPERWSTPFLILDQYPEAKLVYQFFLQHYVDAPVHRRQYSEDEPTVEYGTQLMHSSMTEQGRLVHIRHSSHMQPDIRRNYLVFTANLLQKHDVREPWRSIEEWPVYDVNIDRGNEFTNQGMSEQIIVHPAGFDVPHTPLVEIAKLDPADGILTQRLEALHQRRVAERMPKIILSSQGIVFSHPLEGTDSMRPLKDLRNEFDYRDYARQRLIEELGRQGVVAAELDRPHTTVHVQPAWEHEPAAVAAQAY